MCTVLQPCYEAGRNGSIVCDDACSHSAVVHYSGTRRYRGPHISRKHLLGGWQCTTVHAQWHVIRRHTFRNVTLLGTGSSAALARCGRTRHRVREQGRREANHGHLHLWKVWLLTFSGNRMSKSPSAAEVLWHLLVCYRLLIWLLTVTQASRATADRPTSSRGWLASS